MAKLSPARIAWLKKAAHAKQNEIGRFKQLADLEHVFDGFQEAMQSNIVIIQFGHRSVEISSKTFSHQDAVVHVFLGEHHAAIGPEFRKRLRAALLQAADKVVDDMCDVLLSIAGEEANDDQRSPRHVKIKQKDDAKTEDSKSGTGD